MTLALLNHIVPPRSSRAFTLIEIALCLAIIAFALVAIIGVMPLGMTVQRDNRSDTIINQDGMYWLNLLRSGATGTADLTNFVEWVQPAGMPNQLRGLSASEIIGLLSTPPPLFEATNAPRARVRSITGSAVERDRTGLGFDYILFSQVQPFVGANKPGTDPRYLSNLSSNLYELRVILRYPALPNDQGRAFGNGKKVFRSLVSGQLLATNSPYGPLFFFNPQTLEQVIP